MLVVVGREMLVGGRGAGDGFDSPPSPPFYQTNPCSSSLLLFFSSSPSLSLSPSLSCTIPKSLQSKITSCYATAKPSTTSTSDFTSTLPNNETLTVPYLPHAELDWYSPTTKLSYSGGGQVHDFNSTRSVALASWSDLTAHGFIDDSVRAIFVNVNMYNPNVDLVSATRFTIELSSTGAVYPSAQIRCLPLIRPDRVLKGDGASNYDIGVFVIEMIFYVAVFAYCVVEVKTIRRQGWEYFKNIWNVVE